ncbi:MAG: MlaD family protein [Gemmatimonadaceae bacterium]
MKRSTFITWDQLKVGLMILVALAVVAGAVLKLGQAVNLFTKRYDLVTFLPNASGLRGGGSVAVAGQLVGVVKAIDFQPPTTDTMHTLKVTVAVDVNLKPHIRGDSYAKLRTLGLLGDKILDISPGTPRADVLQPGDTLRLKESLDYEQVIGQAAGAVGDMVQLTHDLRAITGGIVRGEGTMGQLLMSNTLYDQLNGTLTQANSLMRRLQQPNGTFGKLVDDPTLYNKLASLTTSMDSLLHSVQSQQGTLGKLMTDTTLYVHIVGVTTTADSLLKLLTTGNGFAAKMLSDHELYDKLNKSITDLNEILADVRKNPGKYTKGMIKVF